MDKKGSRGSARVLTKGNNTQEEIVGRALRIAAIEGLGALSIGRLAKELRMSKSGLFVHFGSKEKLEIAVVERAYEIFSDHILLPAKEEVTPGIERVWALCNFWLKFVKKRILPGGYFFTGAFWECAPQDGAIARRIRQIVEEWLTALRRAVDGARRSGEIRREVDAERTAFELNSVLIGAQWSYLLAGEGHSEAGSAILRKLGALATENIPANAFDSVGDWKRYLEDPARVTVPKSYRGLLARTNLGAPASMPIALCLSESDDRPTDLAWNGNVAPTTPVSVAVQDSCRRSADPSRIAILLRPCPVSENHQPWQRLKELQLWSPKIIVVEKSLF